MRLENLAMLSGLAQMVYGRWRVRRLVMGMVIVACLTLAAAILASTLLVGGFHTAYMTLVEQMSPQHAFFIVAGSMLLTILVFVLCIIQILKKMRRNVVKPSPFNNAFEVVEAFLEGLTSETSHDRHRR